MVPHPPTARRLHGDAVSGSSRDDLSTFNRLVRERNVPAVIVR